VLLLAGLRQSGGAWTWKSQAKERAPIDSVEGSRNLAGAGDVDMRHTSKGKVYYFRTPDRVRLGYPTWTA